MRSLGPLRRTALATLRDNLRQAAADRGWTLTRCAHEANFSYSKLTQGMSANRWFLAEEINALAAALEVSSDELLGDSVFNDHVRGSKYDVPQPWEKAQPTTLGTTGNGRALCCRCGCMRRFRVDEIDYARMQHDGSPAETGGRRMVLPLRCLVCSDETTHAVLRELGQHQDCAEVYESTPTRERQARQDFKALVARVRSFGVDIHFRRRGEELRKKAFMAGYKFDKSKSRWRIELDMNAPPLVRIRMLKDIWRRIATDEHQVEWNAADGAYLAPIEKYWDEAADDLLADITRALPAEREKYRLEIADELASQDDREASDR